MIKRPSLLLSALALGAVCLTGPALMADQDITLPAPIYLENFDELSEFTFPDGWSVTNQTDTDVAGEDPDNLHSDTYKGWVVISADRLQNLKSGAFNMPAITVNGELLTSLASGNLLYAESDVRSGNQVQYAFTKDYDLSGKQNVYAVFHSLYEQNQDNINSFEYSIDGGATWLPGLYLINQFNDAGADNLPLNQADIYFDLAGNIDAVKTLSTVQGDQPLGKAYGAFIGAPVTADLWPYISGRVNDDATESKRIEIVRLAKADNQSKVRFRFAQAGTASWYWGIDEFGLYSLPEARISIPPQNARVVVGSPATFKVVASGDAPISYQWSFGGNPISGATSDTFTINQTKSTDEGQYTVTVKNAAGEQTSDPVNLVVAAAPQITSQPKGALATAGAPISLSVTAIGATPLSYQWRKDGQPVNGGTSATLTIAKSAVTDTGAYDVVVSNSAGTATSAPAVQVTILPLTPITQDLVVHLPFDDTPDDTSGRGNNATLQGAPGFTTGKIGKALHFVTLKDGSQIDYASLGYPDDLKFVDSTDFSVSFWVNVTSSEDDPSFISNKNWNSSNNPGWGVFEQGGGNTRIQVTGDSNKFSTSATPNVRDGAWHNMVVVFWRGQRVMTYVDGVLANDSPFLTTGTIDTDDIGYAVNIGQDGTGAYTDNGSADIDAMIDDVGIWRRILSPQEAKSIFVQGTQGADLTKASGETLTPPTITSAPSSQAVGAGANVSFTVASDGSTPFTYVWKHNGTVISTATTATLTLNSVTTADAGTYTVDVSNGAGTASATVKLLVSSGVSANLVAHIAFDGNYNDDSGHNNNATPQGAPTLETGKFGQAMRFTTVKDGSKIDYASLGSPADLQFGDSTDFSVSMWVNWTSSEDDLPFISNKDWGSSSNIGWGVFSQGGADPTGNDLRVNLTGTPRGSGNRMTKTLHTGIRDGNWHHVMVSFWRGVAAYTYVDGALVDTSSLAAIVGSVDPGAAFVTNIGQDGTGKYTDGGSVLMTGLIDDVGIWRRALAPSDAAAIFNAGKAGNSLSSFLSSQSNLGRITVTHSGNQVTLTWTGGAGIRLQKSSALPGGWQDVAGTDGTSSRTITASDAAAFYRLVK